MANAHIDELRLAMKAIGALGCLVTTEDPHGSEYPPDCFKVREYISGFTGSAGTLFVAADCAGLWTDGRYFLQAARELEGSGIQLFKQGIDGTPIIYDYIKDAIGEGPLALDARCLSASAAAELTSRGVQLLDSDIALKVWTSRPASPTSPAFVLEEKYAGENVPSKLLRLREKMGRANALIITALDDVAWSFNFRGTDVVYTPVALSYAIVERDAAYLFMDADKARDIATAMAKANVQILPYDGIYSFIEKYGENDVVMVSPNKINSLLYSALSERTQLIEGDPAGGMKCVKNEAELISIRDAHIRDGVTMARFMHWAKTQNAGETEVSIAKKLDEMRLATEGCTDLSFTTIVGYGPHAAVVHYHPTPETDIPIQPRGLLLVDSGAQYIGATTDITRTMALGPTTAEERRNYTLVLEGMLTLLRARFIEGTHGFTLDMLARKPLWDEGLNFVHGTGHGVGAMLGVHEDPVRISVYRLNDVPLMPGMVTSDEPGVYIEGSHGIRIENLVECVELESTPFGRFFGFSTLTYAPIDTAPIDTSLLSERSRADLNAYHQEVYAHLAPHMTAEECEWLREYTKAI